MIKRALIGVGIAVAIPAFMVACITVNLMLTGNLDLDVSGFGPTWW